MKRLLGGSSTIIIRLLLALPRLATYHNSQMSEAKQNQPYKHLGLRLKLLRQKLHESVAEVSGAVEIDPDVLSLIEQGQHCPSEDVLLLLLSHFNLEEDEAVRLWELAGYDQDKMPSSSRSVGDDTVAKPIVMIMQDTRVMYTDMVNVAVNQSGVVINFLQAQGSDQPTAVARVGMSRAQAEQVIAALQQGLYTPTTPTIKALPAPKPAQTDEPAV